MLPAAVEMANEHCNREAQIIQFYDVSNSAASEPARERPHRQVCALGVTGSSCGPIEASNARLTLYPDYHQRIVVARNLLVRLAKDFGFRRIINFVDEHLFHCCIPSAISRESIRTVRLRTQKHHPNVIERCFGRSQQA